MFARESRGRGSVLAVGGPRLFACGDKFLMNGRIAAYAQMMKAAKAGILLVNFAPGSDAAVAFKKADVSLLLTIAGHKFKIETDRAGFDTALASGNNDLALADSRPLDLWPHRSTHPRAPSSCPSWPVESLKQRSAFEKQFGSAVRLPAGDREVVDMLDKAMKVRREGSGHPPLNSLSIEEEL